MFDQDLTSPYFQWDHVPEMRSPVLVMGFHGWSNAGNVSIDTLQYFLDALDIRIVAHLDEEPFLNYATDRPVAQIEEGIIHEIDPMTSELGFYKNPAGEHDLLLFLGKEPHLAWRAYIKIFFNVIKTLKIDRLFTIGGVQDNVSHTAPPIVSIVGSNQKVIADLMELDDGIRAADYYGPVSIHSQFIRMCSEVSIDAVSLWGHVPTYLQRHPRVVSKILELLQTVAGLDFSLEPLRQKSLELDRKISEALARDPDLKQFVESVEKKENIDSAPTAQDHKIIRLNDFIRRDSQKDPDR
jgi:proteasome assembly chaperone (PAC2) family protein